MATQTRPVLLVFGLLVSVCMMVERSIGQSFVDTGCFQHFKGRCGERCDGVGEVPLSNFFCGSSANVQCCARILPCAMHGGSCRRDCGSRLVELDREAKCPLASQRCCVRWHRASFRPPTLVTTPTTAPPPITEAPPPATEAPPTLSIADRQGACGPGALLSSRVLNGFRPEACNWPWMVALRRRQAGIHCSGVLVSPDIVLTAAQCLQGLTPGDLEVLLGTNDVSNPGPHLQIRDVIGIQIHEEFRQGVMGNNLAALRLSAPAKLSPCVLPVCLADPSIPRFPAKRCYVAGWGFSEGGDTSTLNVADVTLLEHALCQSLVILGTGRRQLLSPDLVCSNTDFDYSDLCRGDDGGMLVCQDEAGRWSLVGLVAYFGCNFRLPILYTNTTTHAQWILQAMGV